MSLMGLCSGDTYWVAVERRVCFIAYFDGAIDVYFLKTRGKIKSQEREVGVIRSGGQELRCAGNRTSTNEYVS